MEAMTACAVAALTINDMCKSADRSMVVGELALWEKSEAAAATGSGRLAPPLNDGWVCHSRQGKIRGQDSQDGARTERQIGSSWFASAGGSVAMCSPHRAGSYPVMLAS